MDVETVQVISRIDRLENKIDALTDAVTTMARIEERLVGQAETMKRVTAHIDRMEERVARLEASYWKLAGAVGVVTALAMVVSKEVLARFI
jgi:polyhydroxyalkanoate synthesis regulator phasin